MTSTGAQALAGLVIIVGWLAFWGAAIYVAFHFIGKFW